MKQVIINADDLGADNARNKGIVEAVRAGTVTSVSILANGRALEDALQRVRSLDPSKVSFGVHCNISEGRPLSTGLRVLTGPDGCFLGKAAALCLLMQGGNEVLEHEIARELDIQIKTLKDAGLHLTHIDGHHHAHVFPTAIKTVCAAAKRHGIPWVRIPDEPEPVPGEDDIPYSLMEEAGTFSNVARSARSHLRDTGLRAADHFRGLYLKGRTSLPLMQRTLEELPPGLTEIMVHPGRACTDNLTAGPFSSFSTTDRERELDVLLSEEFRLAVLRFGVILIPFPEADS
jgi:predicted glycoside hydrolase/deacetylase ChbG (UPF0249 family)